MMSNTLSDEQVDMILKQKLPLPHHPSRCQVMGVIKSPTGSCWNMGVCVYVCVCVCVCVLNSSKKMTLVTQCGLFNSAYNTIIHTHTHHYPIKIDIPYNTEIYNI